MADNTQMNPGESKESQAFLEGTLPVTPKRKTRKWAKSPKRGVKRKPRTALRPWKISELTGSGDDDDTSESQDEWHQTLTHNQRELQRSQAALTQQLQSIQTANANLIAQGNVSTNSIAWMGQVIQTMQQSNTVMMQSMVKLASKFDSTPRNQTVTNDAAAQALQRMTDTQTCTSFRYSFPKTAEQVWHFGLNINIFKTENM
eukprot:608350_1